MYTHEILENNADEFAKYVNEMGSLVFAYHPGCGHCDNMKPAWEQLKETTKTMPHNYQLISVHSSALPHIKRTFSVSGFPKILTLHKGGKVHNEYKGDRSYKDLLRFLKKHLKKVKTLKKVKRGGAKKTKRQKAKKAKRTKRVKRVKKQKE